MIDNGRRIRLIIPGLFEGEAGESAGELAFIPNRKGKRAREVSRGLLDDAPIALTLKKGPTSGEPFAVFSYRSVPS